MIPYIPWNAIVSRLGLLCAGMELGALNVQKRREKSWKPRLMSWNPAQRIGAKPKPNFVFFMFFAFSLIFHPNHQRSRKRGTPKMSGVPRGTPDRRDARLTTNTSRNGIQRRVGLYILLVLKFRVDSKS